MAVYEEGPARPTGGAGAVAMLISNKPKIAISPVRSSFMDHQYDFYKPVPSKIKFILGSEYPVVDGKVSMDCYIGAMKACYNGLKSKKKGENLLATADFCCFHTPFYKMIQKAYDALQKIEYPTISSNEIGAKFGKQVEASLFVSKRVGNIYTGSLYASLYSLLYKTPAIADKRVLLFSYGSGLCSTMFEAHIISNPLTAAQIQETDRCFKERVRIGAKEYSDLMMQKEKSYGKWKGKVPINSSLLDEGVFYLDEIDEKWRRTYKVKNSTLSNLVKDNVSSMERLINLDKVIQREDTNKFHKLSVLQRRDIISAKLNYELSDNDLDNGGLSLEMADGMIENVIGKLSLPLGVVPTLEINRRKYMIPMCVEEPSVVAATCSIGKFISPYTFVTSSTPNIMVGQIHLPSIEIAEVNQIMKKKALIINQLNGECVSMVKRGGGVKDIRLRELLSDRSEADKNYSLDILIDVCDAMGANITNTLSEKAKEIVSRMGIKTGISVLSNYCLERKAVSSFIIPVEHMAWKGVAGIEVAKKIMEAYEFARSDTYRAVTHNKGIMNGIDAVCLATGQDWRAIESGAHAYASRNGKYQPLTRYEIIEKEGNKYFKGILELPLAVGTVGGAVSRNPIYQASFNMLGNPSAQELSEILVSVGLAQNFAALRALAIEGIQKGHMKLHARAIATKMGVPNALIEDCCKFMSLHNKFDEVTVLKFMDYINKPRL